MQNNLSGVENNLNKSEQSWEKTINFILENQGTREELMRNRNNKKLFYTNSYPELKEICEYIKTYTTKQAVYINSIIDKTNEFVNEYCKKHEIDVNELALQKNNRAITSDTRGNLFSVMVALTFSGIIFFKNCFFYFDLAHNRFFRSEEEYIQFIKEEIIAANNIHYIKFINIFIKYSEELINILNQNENYLEPIERLKKLINEESENKNHQFNIIKEIKKITETNKIHENYEIYEKKIYTKKEITLKFTDNNGNEIKIYKHNSEFSLKIEAENFSKTSTIYTGTNKNINSTLLKYKKFFIYNILKTNCLNHFYLIPISYINPNLKGKFINLGNLIAKESELNYIIENKFSIIDYIIFEKFEFNCIIENKSIIKFESIVCLVIYALLSQAKPNSIICLLGNHETTLKDNELLQNLIEFCIEKKALRTGYIEKAIKDGKKIYCSYSRAAIDLITLVNLFAILYGIYIDIEIESLRDKGIQESDIEAFIKHIKEKWPRRFSELPEELQTKVINFFDKNNLKQLSIEFDDPDDPNYITEFHRFDDFFEFIIFFIGKPYLLHQILKNAGFNDIDFVELRNALGDIIYNKFLSIISSVSRLGEFIFAAHKENFINAQKIYRTNQKTPDSLLDNIYQHVSNFPNYFTVIPENLNGLFTNHNVLVDCHNEIQNFNFGILERHSNFYKTETRINLFILNIITNDFFIIDGFVSRNGNEISKKSQIIIDDSISQIIFHSERNCNTYMNYNELKEYVSEIENFSNNKIDENLIKKSLTKNNELEETKIILAESKGYWQTAINFINQTSKPINNSETATKDLSLIKYIEFDLNSLINKIYKSAKHTEPNDLKENSYFSLIVALIKQNIITLDKSFSLYFDLKNNEFTSKEKLFKSKSAILLINIFLENFDDFMNLCPTPDYNKKFGYLENFSYEFSKLLTLKSLINKIAYKTVDLIMTFALVNVPREVEFSNDKGNFIIELEPEKIKFSDDNGNYIYIDTSNTKFFDDKGNSIPSEKFLCIEINSKTNLNRDYKNSSKIDLDPYLETYKSKLLVRYEDLFLGEKFYNYDYPTYQEININSYFQAVKDVVLSWQKDLMDDLIKSKKEDMKFYFEIPIPITQSKKKFICFLKEPNNVIQQIKHEELSKKEFIEKLIEIYDQKNKETITCLMTLALTTLSNPNIKFILSNYETTFSGNEYFAKIIDYCIEEKIFINGYVEEKTEGDKQIWHSYFPAIFTKKHLQKLFAILFILIYIDKEIQRLNYFGKELSFYLENYLKAKWTVKLKELPKESQEKLLSFFNERNLQALNLNTWEDFFKMDWQNFYEILIKAKFTDIEFFLLKIIVCDIFHNEYYSEANQIWKLLFSAITGKMNWLYHEEYIPQNSNETFSVIQHLGQYYESLPQNLNCFNTELIQLPKTEYNFLDDEAKYNLVSSSDDEEEDKIKEEDLATPIEIPPLIPGDQSELSEP